MAIPHLDDNTPPPPAGQVNVKWQQDPQGRISGHVPASIGGSGGVGDVVGPSTATPDHVATFNGSTGKVIKDSGIASALITAHHTRHENGGADEISVTGLSGLLGDPQTPLGHHTSHESGGSDAIKLDDLAAPDDNTDLDASTAKHGLLKKLDNDASHFLDGQGNWATPSGGSSSPLTTKGDVWGYSSVDDRIPIGSDTTVLKADSAETLGLKWEAVKDSELSTSDITTNDSSTSKHGFLKKLDNDSTHFMRGDGSWAAPPSGGSAGVPWPAFTAPVNGDYAWINQGGASVNATATGIYLLAPATTGDAYRIRKKSAPTAPYTITIGLLPQSPNVNSALGLILRESGSGKFIILTYIYQGKALQVVQYNSPTSWNATPSSLDFSSVPSPHFLRIYDDNTNRHYSYSVDGVNFIEVYSDARTTFITADEAGFAANASQNSYDVGMTLVHWKET